MAFTVLQIKLIEARGRSLTDKLADEVILYQALTQPLCSPYHALTKSGQRVEEEWTMIESGTNTDRMVTEYILSNKVQISIKKKRPPSFKGGL